MGAHGSGERVRDGPDLHTVVDRASEIAHHTQPVQVQVDDHRRRRMWRVGDVVHDRGADCASSDTTRGARWCRLDDTSRGACRGWTDVMPD